MLGPGEREQGEGGAAVGADPPAALSPHGAAGAGRGMERHARGKRQNDGGNRDRAADRSASGAGRGRRRCGASWPRRASASGKPAAWRNAGNRWPRRRRVFWSSNSRRRSPTPCCSPRRGCPRDYPLARWAAVAARPLAHWQWLLREAGAVDFVVSPRRLGPLAQAICRHLASVPPPPQSLTERIWAGLPWEEEEGLGIGD